MSLVTILMIAVDLCDGCELLGLVFLVFLKERKVLYLFAVYFGD